MLDKFGRFLKGHKISKKTKQKMSKERKKRFAIKQNHPSWKGGRTTHQNYILISKPNHPLANNKGYVREHRPLLTPYNLF